MWTWWKSGKVFIGAETETMASWRSSMSTFTNCRWVDITLYRVVIVAKNSLYGARWADVNVYLLDFWIDTGRFDWQRHWWWSNQTQPELSKRLMAPTMLVKKNTHRRKRGWIEHFGVTLIYSESVTAPRSIRLPLFLFIALVLQSTFQPSCH